jgi:hypothetical protein
MDSMAPFTDDDKTKKAAGMFEKWDGKNPEVAKWLCTWGKAESLAIETDTTAEFADRGGNVHFFGSVLKYARNCYRT